MVTCTHCSGSTMINAPKIVVHVSDNNPRLAEIERLEKKIKEIDAQWHLDRQVYSQHVDKTKFAPPTLDHFLLIYGILILLDIIILILAIVQGQASGIGLFTFLLLGIGIMFANALNTLKEYNQQWKRYKQEHAILTTNLQVVTNNPNWPNQMTQDR